MISYPEEFVTLLEDAREALLHAGVQSPITGRIKQALERHEALNAAVSELAVLVDQAQFPQARQRIAELEAVFGASEPEFTHIATLISFLE